MIRDNTIFYVTHTILLSYDIRDEIIEDMDSQIVVDTSVYKTNLP